MPARRARKRDPHRWRVGTPPRTASVLQDRRPREQMHAITQLHHRGEPRGRREATPHQRRSRPFPARERVFCVVGNVTIAWPVPCVEHAHPPCRFRAVDGDMAVPLRSACSARGPVAASGGVGRLTRWHSPERLTGPVGERARGPPLCGGRGRHSVETQARSAQGDDDAGTLRGRGDRDVAARPAFVVLPSGCGGLLAERDSLQA